MRDIGRGGLVADRSMRPTGVVIFDQRRAFLTGVVEAEKQGLLEHLFAHPAVDPKGGEVKLSAKPFWVGLPGSM